MSDQNIKAVRCPKCGKTMRTAFTPVVNANQSPKLREMILNKKFFRCTCKKCGHRAMLLSRCLYVDEERGFMVYLVPEFEGKSLVNPRIERAYPETAHFKRRVVTGINRMKEKILLFEAGLDDRAVELAKLAMVGVIARRRTVQIQEVYFNELDETEDRIGFTFLSGNGESSKYRTRAEIFRVSQEVAADYLENHPEQGFEHIDLRWAARVIGEYRSSEAERTRQEAAQQPTDSGEENHPNEEGDE